MQSHSRTYYYTIYDSPNIFSKIKDEDFFRFTCIIISPFLVKHNEIKDSNYCEMTNNLDQDSFTPIFFRRPYLEAH